MLHFNHSFIQFKFAHWIFSVFRDDIVAAAKIRRQFMVDGEEMCIIWRREFLAFPPLVNVYYAHRIACVPSPSTDRKTLFVRISLRYWMAMPLWKLGFVSVWLVSCYSISIFNPYSLNEINYLEIGNYCHTHTHIINEDARAYGTFRNFRLYVPSENR